MPISAAGSPRRWPAGRGFTLLELLVVLAIVAFVSAAVGFAMRDDVQTRLEREAARLAALLESGRARSQASGVAVRWYPTAQGFRFDGLTLAERPEDGLPQDWLDPDTDARVEPTSPLANGAGNPQQQAARGTLLLGPEPILVPQTLTLFSRTQPQKQVRLGSDGVRPFALQDAAP